jgi:hypothetical protein
MVINRAPDDPVEQVVLFDRDEDPHQLTNVAETRPDVVRQLLERELVPWMARTGDPMTRPANVRRETPDVGFLGGIRCPPS